MKTYRVGGIKMPFPIILGAGVCKDPIQLIPYMRDDISLGAVIAGSATPDPRPVNEGVVQWPEDWTAFCTQGAGLNSLGMPNPGIEEFLERFASVSLFRRGISSLAAFSPEGYAHCARLANRYDNVSAIEVNWGCGNTGKVPDAYNLENARATLHALERLNRSLGYELKPIWVKLSPYITAAERDELAVLHPDIDFTQAPVVTAGFAETMVRLVAQYPFIKAIVFSNTLANCRVLGPDGTPVTTPFDGKAGLSGPILKKISLNLIRRAIEVLPPWNKLDFIGCGGVLTGDDAVDYFEAGAAGVQCVSGPAWYNDGPRFFADLIEGSEHLQHYLTREEA